MEIDLTPVLDMGIDLLAVVLMGLGTWALAKLGRKFGLEADDQIRLVLQEALEKGVGYARERAREQGDDFARIEVRNAAAATAANYVIGRVPQAAAHFGLNEDGLRELVRARLGGVD